MVQALQHSGGIPHPIRLEVRRPVAVDLFAGAGGLSLAFEQAGFDVVASVEYDPVHAAVHSYNFPRTEELCRDAAGLSGGELRQAVMSGYAAHGGSTDWDGDVDAIIGGPPCQGFSLIGRRLIDDQRNRLVYEFFRLVSVLRPKYVVMENVPGMLSGGHSSILAELIAEFEEAGYNVLKPVGILNAADYGAPQNRRRLFLIAARGNLPLPDYPDPTFLRITGGDARDQQAAGTAIGPNVMDALRDLPDPDSFEELIRSDEVRLSTDVLAYLEDHASPYARLLRGLDLDPEDLSYRRAWDPSLLTSSMRTSHTPLSVRRFAATPPGQTEPVSRFFRLPPDGLSNTLRAGTGSERGGFTSPRPIHPLQPRVITVREAARLHGFPDWFRLHRTKWHGFRQVGNAVVPPVGRAVAARLVEVLKVDPPKPPDRLELGNTALLSLDMRAATTHFGADRSAVPQTRKRLVRA